MKKRKTAVKHAPPMALVHNATMTNGPVRETDEVALRKSAHRAMKRLKARMRRIIERGED